MKAKLPVILGLGLGVAVSAAGGDFREDLLAKFERVPLAQLPTPLEELKALSRDLGGPPLYVKRDDQTGLAFGGNKARKLEFIFADVLQKKSDVIITWAGIQSNWARQTTAAARIHGIRPILVLTRGEHSPNHGGNLLLDSLMGADVRLIDPAADRASIVGRIAEEERAGGHRPYVVPVGGSVPSDSMDLPLGAIAYAHGFSELHEQAAELGITFDHVVLATGSGGTQAGLMVGASALAPHVKVVGISVSGEKQVVKEQVARIANETAEALELSNRFSPEETIVIDDYIGEAYGVVNEATAMAIGELARREGILLDPVYTGKAMAGMLDLIKKGYFEGSRGVVFVHTGGTPALFAYEDELLSHLGQKP
ncbi:MAG TPA: D-cysteine desulfhydrase family protein [Vicinamibacteria bacterium]|nr:D-cysteine desulfhydrase family protein [Vicinamibacteria bacterium]